MSSPLITKPVLLSRLIPEGTPGIKVTLQRMAVLARKGIRDVNVTTLSRKIVESAPIQDKKTEAGAIFNWVVKNIRYVKDPVQVELIMHPARLLEIGSGDCDDLSILIAALAESIGIPARFVAIQTRGDGQYNHVYPELWVDSRWVGADRANSNPRFGYSPTSSGNRLIQPVTISGEPSQSLEDFALSSRLFLSSIVIGGLLLVGVVVYSLLRKRKADGQR